MIGNIFAHILTSHHIHTEYVHLCLSSLGQGLSILLSLHRKQIVRISCYDIHRHIYLVNGKSELLHSFNNYYYNCVNV